MQTNQVFMTKNNLHISSPQNVMRDPWLANFGAGSVENLAKEPSEPANVFSISLQLFRKDTSLLK